MRSISYKFIVFFLLFFSLGCLHLGAPTLVEKLKGTWEGSLKIIPHKNVKVAKFTFTSTPKIKEERTLVFIKSEDIILVNKKKEPLIPSNIDITKPCRIKGKLIHDTMNYPDGQKIHVARLMLIVQSVENVE